jgi:hypothetical protein
MDASQALLLTSLIERERDEALRIRRLARAAEPMRRSPSSLAAALIGRLRLSPAA